MATGQDILLGHGIFSINELPVGLTRGGGKFITEREVRELPADGDRGPVKGRILIDTEIPKITVRSLELFNPTDMKRFYPALSYDEITKKITSTLKVADEDYVDVKWEGFKKNGKKVIIIVKNAINMGNIEWDMVDKEETVPEVEYTGTYLEEERETPPYEIEYPDDVVA